MKILAFESSCDETAVAVVEDGRRILSDAIASQADMHALYGGVVPEIAPAPAAAPSQAVRIVNVIDPGMAADYLNSAAGEKTILNVLSRNGSAVRELLR